MRTRRTAGRRPLGGDRLFLVVNRHFNPATLSVAMDPDDPLSPSLSRQQRLPTADYIAAATASPPVSPTDSSDTVLPRAISLENVSVQLNEESPLLSPTNAENGGPSLQYNGAPLRGSQLSDFDRSKSMLYLIFLTMGLAG